MQISNNWINDRHQLRISIDPRMGIEGNPGGKLRAVKVVKAIFEGAISLIHAKQLVERIIKEMGPPAEEYRFVRLAESANGVRGALEYYVNGRLDYAWPIYNLKDLLDLMEDRNIDIVPF